MKRIFVLLFCVLLVLSGCAEKETIISEKGKVSFTVIDGFSGLPLEGVRLVLPENNCEVISDYSGKTESVEVNVIKAENLTVPQDYGIFSVLGYKEGYNDYALFFAQIKSGQERNIKVYMFMKDTPMSSGRPMATVESPDKQWVSELIEKYRN